MGTRCGQIDVHMHVLTEAERQRACSGGGHVRPPGKRHQRRNDGWCFARAGVGRDNYACTLMGPSGREGRQGLDVLSDEGGGRRRLWWWWCRCTGLRNANRFSVICLLSYYNFPSIPPSVRRHGADATTNTEGPAMIPQFPTPSRRRPS